MTVGRGLVLIALFVGMGLLRVHLRSEETRMSARIQNLLHERIQLRRESWALQMEIARLSTPDRIRNRTDQWRLEVRAPWPMNLADVEGQRLARQ